METPVQIPDTFPKGHIAKLKILLAEDSLVNQKVILNHLKQLGGTADVVEDGRAALEMIHTTDYDIILMDCHMPTLDGYSTTQTIRSLARSKRPIIIAMTAILEQEDWAKCLKSGMDDYLSKPIQTNELAAKLLYWSNQIATATWNGDSTSAASLPNSSFSPTSQSKPLSTLIDWDYLHELSDGSEAFELELLETLINATSPRLDILKTSIATANFQTIEQQAHYIKGSTASVGAKSIEPLAARLEQQAQTHQLQGMSDLLQQIEQGLSEIEALITLIHP
jgi:CheY-like chemotaxis protein